MQFNSEPESAHSQSNHGDTIERRGDDILIIQNVLSRSFAFIVVLIVVGVAAALVLSMFFPDSIPALFLFILVIIAFASLITKRTFVEIDRSKGIVQKKWTLLIFKGGKVYPLSDFRDINIEEKRQVLEGYPLPYYSLKLDGRKTKLEIVSIDDLKEARKFQSELSRFLKLSGRGCRVAG